jgi:hypothetical protein
VLKRPGDKEIAQWRSYRSVSLLYSVNIAFYEGCSVRNIGTCVTLIRSGDYAKKYKACALFLILSDVCVEAIITGVPHLWMLLPDHSTYAKRFCVYVQGSVYVMYSEEV